MSPSTRRAWIEIYGATLENGMVAVALHPEGVDRNPAYEDTSVEARRSPSTRRAWIEIERQKLYQMTSWQVALHPEGVDRNA